MSVKILESNGRKMFYISPKSGNKSNAELCRRLVNDFDLDIAEADPGDITVPFDPDIEIDDENITLTGSMTYEGKGFCKCVIPIGEQLFGLLAALSSDMVNELQEAGWKLSKF